MDHWTQGRRHQRSEHWVTGLTLIGVGSLFLLDRLDYIEAANLKPYWPFIIAVVGVARIIDARSATQMAKGGFLIFLAFWLYASIEHLWGLSFHTSWPILLIALGLRYMVAGLADTSRASIKENRV